MEGIVAMFTASSSRALSARAAVVERLRRVLFSPQRLLTAGTLACVLACGGYAAGQTPINEYDRDYNIAELAGKTLDLTGAIDYYYSFDSEGKPIFNSYAGKTISLGGGTLKLNGGAVVTESDGSDPNVLYDKYYIWANFKTDKWTDLSAPSNAELAELLNKKYSANEYYEPLAHTIDVSAGGEIYVGDGVVGISTQTINGSLTKSGAGMLTISDSEWVKTDNGYTPQFTGTTKITGELNVTGGILSIFGDANYQGDVEAHGGEFIAASGTQNFAKNIYSAYGGDVTLAGANDKPITVNGTTEVTIDGELWSFDNVDYNGNILIRNYLTDDTEKVSNIGYAQAVFTCETGSERPSFGQNSQLVIDGYATQDANGSSWDQNGRQYNSVVYANANCLDVDVTLKNDGVLNYVSFSTNKDDKAISDSFYITYDENKTPTVLEWTAGSSNIQKALDNGNVITKNITSTSSNTQLYLSTGGYEETDQLGAANGYTVVFNNADGKKFDYAGMTIVDKAFMVIQGDTNFGSHNAEAKQGNVSCFRVVGEAYSKANPDFWEVYGCGMLGFDRDENATADASAPSITADLVEFTPGRVTQISSIIMSDYQTYRDNLLKEYEDATGKAPTEEIANKLMLQATQMAVQKNAHVDGARIWIDTSSNTEDKTFKLGAINANAIVFADNTEIWYDKISTHASDVNMTFELNAPNIIRQVTSENITAFEDQNKNTVIGYQTYDELATPEYIEDLFNKPLVSANVNANVNADTGAPAGYTVTVNAIGVEKFAENEGMSQTEIDYAKKFDEARLDSNANVQFNDALYNENDGSKVRQTIHNLSLLGHSMLNQHSHVGNPTSAFFGGASLSASTKRGQDAQNDAPLADLPQESAINNNEKEQEEYNPTRGLWASFTHTSVDGDTYQDRGMTMHGYDLRRSGVIGGMKRQYDATLSGGLFFGLTLPEIESNAANANSGASVYSKMEMTDFQFAGHLEKIIADNWELCLFVGGGHQSMDWERTVNQKYQYTADSTGNTLTGTAYLAYRINMNDRWTIRPTVGLDSEHSWLYNFTETGGELGSLAELGYANQMLAQRYRYEDTYYNRNLARVGFTTAFDGAQGWAGLNARAFYSTQLGGKPSALLTYRTVGDVNDANYLDLNFEDMGSHVMGSDAFSVGGGGYMHLNKTKTLTANGDINAIWYKNASTLNVTGGVSYRF